MSTGAPPHEPAAAELPAAEFPLLGAESRERADAARNRERVLCAAERLFAEHGVDCVTMDAVAAEAGVGKGTLFRRFGDRAGLARAVIGERERRFQEAFIRGPAPLGPGAPPVERLIAFGHGFIELLESHGDLLAAAEAGAGGATFRSRSPYAAYRAHVTMLVREADAEVDAEYVADALLAALRADLVLHMRRERQMDCRRVREGWELLVRRLLSGR